VLYVDTSAFMKLVHEERESSALRDAVRGRRLFSSELLLCEALRAAGRYGGVVVDAAERALNAVSLVPLSAELLRAAGTLPPTKLQSLDALHLVTALRAGVHLEHLLTYDSRMQKCARSHGISVLAPS